MERWPPDRFDPAQGGGRESGHAVDMISLEDCIALCGLTDDEVAAIAEHEHLPDLAAAVLGQYLLHQQHGPDQIRRMIVDDIRRALQSGDKAHAAALFGALRHFMSSYPACEKANV